MFKKFARRWFGLYVVVVVNDYAIYFLCELDDTLLTLPIAERW